MNKQETEKKIKELREAKCQYPIQEEGKMKSCGKRQMMSVSLPVVNFLEGGKIEASEGMNVTVPLCDYHCFLAMSSGVFGVKTDEKLGKCQLVAPFDAIHLAEAVVDAMAMTGKIQEIFKAKEKAKEGLKNVKTN